MNEITHSIRMVNEKGHRVDIAVTFRDGAENAGIDTEVEATDEFGSRLSLTAVQKVKAVDAVINTFKPRWF